MLRSSFVPSQIHRAFLCSVLPTFSPMHALPLSAPTTNGVLYDNQRLALPADSGQLTYYAPSSHWGPRRAFSLSVSRMLPRTVMSPTPNFIGQHSCNLGGHDVPPGVPGGIPPVFPVHSLWVPPSVCSSIKSRFSFVSNTSKNEITANGKKSMWTGTKKDKNFLCTASTSILSLINKQ